MEDTNTSIDVLGVLRGCIGAVVGVNDWDVSRIAEAKEIVVYVFGSREKALLATRELKRARDMRLHEVDAHFGTTFEVELGAGKPPSAIAPYPHKVRVLAEHGFLHDPIKTFERAVDLIEEGAWGEHPGRRPPPRAVARRASRDGAGREETEKPGALGCAPRMDAQTGRSYTLPQFKQQVRGYYRPINPTSWGKGESGKRTLRGETFVKSHPRGKDRPARPEAEPAGNPSP